MLTDLSDLHGKEPLSLVKENTLTLAVFQVLHHSPYFIGCLSCLTKVCPTSKTCHNHLMGEKRNNNIILYTKNYCTEQKITIMVHARDKKGRLISV